MAGASTPAKQEATAAKEEAVVEYVGSADEVKVSAADFKAAGVEGDQKQVVFNARNKMRVPASEFSKEALEALSVDDRFKLPEA